MSNAYNYVKDHGLTDESYTYTGRDESCKRDQFTDPRVFVSGYTTLAENTVDCLSGELSKHVVAVAVEVNYEMQSYKRGVFQASASCGSRLNHAVLLVGQNTCEESGLNYYAVKNSWGTTWGEDGYIRMDVATGRGTCGIANSWDAVPTLMD